MLVPVESLYLYTILALPALPHVCNSKEYNIFLQSCCYKQHHACPCGILVLVQYGGLHNHVYRLCTSMGYDLHYGVMWDRPHAVTLSVM